MRVVYTAAAQVDLVEIAGWIALENPVRAETFAQELRTACDTLSDYPQRFQLLPRYESTGIRRRPYGNYLIFYWDKVGRPLKSFASFMAHGTTRNCCFRRRNRVG